jgi:hypothetical protein
MMSAMTASTLLPASHREQARISSKNANSLQTRTTPVPLHSEQDVVVVSCGRALSFACAVETEFSRWDLCADNSMPLSQCIVRNAKASSRSCQTSSCSMKPVTTVIRSETVSFAAQKLVQTNGFVYCISQLLQSGSYDGGNHENQTTRTPASSGNPA